MPISPNSLLVDGAFGWHRGDKKITYAFIARVPGYYETVDTNGDDRADAYLIETGDIGEPDFLVPFSKSVGMSGAEIRMARKALDEWAAVAKLNLVEVKPGAGVKTADITLAAYTFEDTATYGFVGDLVDGAIYGEPGRLGHPSRVGDFWLNKGMPEQADTEYGNTGWQTYLHELGHAIGLHHPNDEGEPDRPVAGHNNQYTVMSYVPHPGVAGLRDAADQDWPLTPMIYDIAAIQKLYGANFATRSGNTTYFASGSDAYALKDGGLLSNGRTAILTIWDGGGIDTIDAANQTGEVRIDLNPGRFSTIGDVENNIAIALAVPRNGKIANLIENATGGRGDDFLIGNTGANVLNGGFGADVLKGGVGRDTFFFAKKPSAANIDHIRDFRPVDDTIRLENTGTGLFTELALGKLHAGEFVNVDSKSATVSADAHILYDKARGGLYYDVNGGDAVGRVQFAVIDNHAGLTTHDFLVA